MCGIVGAIGWVDARIEAAVRAMNGAQAHRGPDAEGVWLSPSDSGRTGVAFAHRRLAIIDLSRDGTQPMVDRRTGNSIVFNGEIYNHHALRRELEREGARFETRTDTEVLLKAYGRWGAECVDRLRGMFAFAVYDAKERQVLIARDRLGIKPLYFHERRGGDGERTLLFASELRTLLASGLIARNADPEGLSSYLWHGFVHSPGTMVRGIELVPAGTLMRVDLVPYRVAAQRYWRPPKAEPRERRLDALRAKLAETVALHLESDVPLGVFLSGGIDSSAMASLAVEADKGAVRTFNISFEEDEYDESRHARAVAEELGTEHTDVRLSEETFHNGLEAAIASIDQPTFDALNTYFISRAVRGAGITVALAGTGGDELFGGYKSFIDIPRAARWTRLLGETPQGLRRRLSRVVSRLKMGRAGEVPPQTRWGKLEDVLATKGSFVDLYQVSYALFSRDFARTLSTREEPPETRLGLTRAHAQELERLIEDEPALHAVSLLELESFLGERLLRDTDAASMAVALEVRVPFLDHELVECVARLDEKLRFEPLGKKDALRRAALEKLDPKLFDRPKSGFVLPIARWCRDRLKDDVASVLHDADACERAGLDPVPVRRLWRAFQAGAPGIYWSRVWALFVLLRWCESERIAV